MNGQRQIRADEQASDWRAILISHALRIRSEGVADGGAAGQSGAERTELVPRLDPAERKVLGSALGPMAEEGLRIVESYALGARSREVDAGASVAAAAPPQFLVRLNIILNGLEPEKDGGNEVEETAPQVIQSELWQLLYKIRESAELSYSRELDLVELDRRILFLLRNVGPIVPAAISNAVGVDKAQVSRSVKRLLELKMIERGQLRSPVRLTRKGAALSDRLARLADLRNCELTFDVGDDELAHFFSIIEALLDRAMQLYERERAVGQSNEKLPERFPLDKAEEARSGEPMVLDRTHIISPLMTLSSYFSRSGALTFKRLTKLSNFEVWVLNEIGMDPPIEWGSLVARIDRDHSQAGRTVNALVDRGFVEREGRPGRRHGRFSLTAKGQKLYEIIQEASRQRSAFLLAPLSQADRGRFLSTFDKIRRNAVVQLSRERAFEEFDKR